MKDQKMLHDRPFYKTYLLFHFILFRMMNWHRRMISVSPFIVANEKRSVITPGNNPKLQAFAFIDNPTRIFEKERIIGDKL